MHHLKVNYFISIISSAFLMTSQVWKVFFLNHSCKQSWVCCLCGSNTHTPVTVYTEIKSQLRADEEWRTGSTETKTSRDVCVLAGLPVPHGCVFSWGTWGHICLDQFSINAGVSLNLDKRNSSASASSQSLSIQSPWSGYCQIHGGFLEQG